MAKAVTESPQRKYLRELEHAVETVSNVMEEFPFKGEIYTEWMKVRNAVFAHMGVALAELESQGE